MSSIEETRWGGEPAITLRCGELAATFLPDVGMTGVSLEYRGDEYLAVPGGVSHLRAGSTAGLPLLAPWANRLAGLRYRAAGVDVDLERMQITTDANGLPIHGLLVGQPGWVLGRSTASGSEARLTSTMTIDSEAFPFPHRIELTVVAEEQQLVVETQIAPTGSRPVPIAFGWHPYLRLPGGTRANWQLELPARRHLALDRFSIPTGAEDLEVADSAPVGGRTLDDLYALGDDRVLAIRSEGATLEMRSGDGYPYAQVWVPPGRDFLALEPMTAPTNALGRGKAPLCHPGDDFTASFALAMR